MSVCFEENPPVSVSSDSISTRALLGNINITDGDIMGDRKVYLSLDSLGNLKAIDTEYPEFIGVSQVRKVLSAPKLPLTRYLRETFGHVERVTMDDRGENPMARELNHKVLGGLYRCVVTVFHYQFIRMTIGGGQVDPLENSISWLKVNLEAIVRP
jgi:hypothetical protein